MDGRDFCGIGVGTVVVGDGIVDVCGTVGNGLGGSSSDSYGCDGAVVMVLVGMVVRW